MALASVVLCTLATVARAASPVIYSALSTTTTGLGSPYSACGLFPSNYVDDDGKPLPYIVLNTYLANGVTPGPFANGANCGRWIQFKAGDPCSHGSNTNTQVCIYDGKSGPGNYDKVGDTITHENKTLYGYIANACADNDYWCRQDPHHLGISFAYLQSVYGASVSWLNRKVTWAYMEHVPPGWKMAKLKFEWAINASNNWRTVIVYNLPSGISGIALKMANGQFARGVKLASLGQQWTLPSGNVFQNVFTVQVFTAAGTPYPGAFNLTAPPK